MNFTHTRIYKMSLQLVGHSRGAMQNLPPGYGFLADQLRRAAASVTLNFAEGCGKRSLRDRRRFFDTAKGSVYEVAAVLDVARQFSVLDDGVYEDGRALCNSLAAMLARFR